MHYCYFKFSKIILSLLFILIGTNIFAQYNSPFSRYGIGNKVDNAAINYRGMAGAGIADNNATLINNLNPASFSNIRFATLQFGVNGFGTTIKSSSTSNFVGKVDLSYLQVGFPLAKNTGTSFGIMPEYQTNYTLRNKEAITGIDTTLNTYYSGKGLLSKVYWGVGQRYKGFSIGANAYYLFGNTTHVIDKIYASSTSNNYYYQDSTRYGGFGFELGASYELSLKKQNKLSFGLTYRPNISLNSSQHSYNAGYSYTSSGFGVYDTVYNATSIKGKTMLPSKLGIGTSYTNYGKWKLNADFVSENNKKFVDNGNLDSVTNGYMASIGVAILPSAAADLQNYFKNGEYRFGVFYGRDYLRINDDIDIYGLSFGAGLPLRKTLKSFGQLNASLQVGSRGTIQNNKIRENFIRFGLGVTFNDKWFVKRKYD